MKKGLFIGGALAILGATYYFFKKQYDLAVSSDFNIKKIRVLSLTDNKLKVQFDLEVINKSSFALDILRYDFKFMYRGVQLANAYRDEQITVMSDSSFNISAIGEVDLKSIKSIALDFAQEILKGKKTVIQIDGYFDVKALGISKRVNFDNNDVLYQGSVLEDAGLQDDLDKVKSKINDILGVVGIKL